MFSLDPGEFEIIAGGTDELFDRVSDATALDGLFRSNSVLLLEQDEWYLLDDDALNRAIDIFEDGAVTDLPERLQLIAPPIVSLHARPTEPSIVLANEQPVRVYLDGPDPREQESRGAAAPDTPWTYAEPPGDEGPTPEAFFRRTPHLAADDQLPTDADATFTVTVRLDDAPPAGNEESQDLLIEAPLEVDAIGVVVLLSTTPHFDVTGVFAREIFILRDDTPSDPVTFTVRVADPAFPGPAGIVAQLLYRGRTCGKVRCEWSWPEGVATPLGTTVEPIAVHVDAEAPDYTVLIGAPINNGVDFTCSVWAKDLPGWTGYTRPEAFAIQGTARGAVDDWFADFYDSLATGPARRSKLRQAGRAFWNAAPPSFKNLLVDVFKQRDPAKAGVRPTVYIASDDPVLPWELMLPATPRLGGGEDDRPAPLGVEFAVGRWSNGTSVSPPQMLPISDIVLAAPTYDTDGEELDKTVEEAALRRLSSDVTALETVTAASLEEHFATDDASLLHFVCHGKVDSREWLALDHGTPFTAAQMRDSPAFQRAFRERKPVVFLNACQVGQLNQGLRVGGSGFPRALSELGARAVIAPLWYVSTKNAPAVAAEIYARALDSPGLPVAAIIAELRARSFDEGREFDDSWAAYCYFGDPCARLQRASG